MYQAGLDRPSSMEGQLQAISKCDDQSGVLQLARHPRHDGGHLLCVHQRHLQHEAVFHTPERIRGRQAHGESRLVMSATASTCRKQIGKSLETSSSRLSSVLITLPNSRAIQVKCDTIVMPQCYLLNFWRHLRKTKSKCVQMVLWLSF